MTRGAYRIMRPFVPSEDDDRDAPPLNPTYEARVRDAKRMLLSGEPHRAIREVHGGAVLEEVLELEREARKRRY